MIAFFVQKCFVQLFSNNSFALNFFGERVLAQKLLVLTKGVNFTTILRSRRRDCPRLKFHQHFTRSSSYESVLPSFFLLIVWLNNFWRRNIGAKAALEMLVKLTIQGLTLSSKIGKAFFTTKSRSTKKIGTTIIGILKLNYTLYVITEILKLNYT